MVGEKMGDIIKLSEFKQIRKEIEKLRQQLEELLYERDELKYTICENIETQYLLIFGSLEYKVYDTYCYYLRLRRKRELIQAKKNRQEKVSIQAIEKQLDREFKEYQENLQEKIAQINQAIERSQLDILTEEESKTLKKLYRSIVKRLHPDVNPSITPAEKELFNNATEAYKNGDLFTLQIIFEIVETYGQSEEATKSNLSLPDEKQRLEMLVSKVREEISQIKTTVPYIWRAYVEDEAAKNERCTELNKLLKSYQEAIRTQEEYIDSLKEDTL